MPRLSTFKRLKALRESKAKAQAEGDVKEKAIPLSGEELVIKCLLDPKCVKSRARAHRGAFAQHEIRRYIMKFCAKESISKSVDSWLPSLLNKMAAEDKLTNVNAGVPNLRPYYKMSEGRLKKLVEIEYITPEQANPWRFTRTEKSKSIPAALKRKKKKAVLKQAKGSTFTQMYNQVMGRSSKTKKRKMQVARESMKGKRRGTREL